jgi:predicted RNA polymerase sigma factor
VTEEGSRRAIEAVFRIESARLIAGLMRLVRGVDLATKAELRAAESTAPTKRVAVRHEGRSDVS